MSFNGFIQFADNLKLIMQIEKFKKADDGEKLRIGHRLLRSKYGLGSFFGFGKVHPLGEEKYE